MNNKTIEFKNSHLGKFLLTLFFVFLSYKFFETNGVDRYYFWFGVISLNTLLYWLFAKASLDLRIMIFVLTSIFNLVLVAHSFVGLYLVCLGRYDLNCRNSSMPEVMVCASIVLFLVMLFLWIRNLRKAKTKITLTVKS